MGMPNLQFIRDLFAPRNVSAAPNGWYKPVRATSDSNLYNAFETTDQPPPMELAGTFGYLQPISPGPGPGTFGTLFPLEAFDAYIPAGFGVPPGSNPGLLLTQDFIGGGPLWTSPDSAPQQELV